MLSGAPCFGGFWQKEGSETDARGCGRDFQQGIIWLWFADVVSCFAFLCCLLDYKALYTWQFVPVEKPVPCNQSTSSSSF